MRDFASNGTCPGLRQLLAIAGAALALTFVTDEARAAQPQVVSAANSGEGSLRAAVGAAADGDVIAIAPGVHPLLDSSIQIAGKQISIQGPGGAETTISAQLKDRIFVITESGDLTLERVKLTAGLPAPSHCGPPPGGAIHSAGTLTIRHSTLTGNATVDGCRLLAEQGGDGGAIYNTGTLTIESSTFVDNTTGVGGDVSSGKGGRGGEGGAIYNLGSLLIEDSNFTSNATGYGAPAGDSSSSEAGDGGRGGAIFQAGAPGSTLTVKNSTFDGNKTGGGRYSSWTRGGSGGDGGAIFIAGSAEHWVESSQFTGNSTGSGGGANTYGSGGRGGDGGAIYSVATLWIERSSFAGNTTGAGGTGTATGGSTSAGRGGDGGAIFNGGTGQLSIEKTALTDNRTGGGGSADGEATPGRGGDGGAIAATTTVSMQLADTILTGNRTGKGGDSYSNRSAARGGHGGAISSTAAESLTVVETTISENTTGPGGGGYWTGSQDAPKHGDGGDGGGIAFGGDGDLYLSRSVLDGNRTGDGGTSTRTPPDPGSGGDGGGIFQDGAGLLALDASTVSTNATGLATDASGGDGSGGGIYRPSNTSTTTLSNSTLSANQSEGHGGGIYDSGSLTVTLSTIAYNEAGENGGGIFISTSPLITASILSGNDARVTGDNCDGVISSGGFNVVDSATGCGGFGAGDLIGSDPELGPLADNGGPTPTHAISPDSPAFDFFPTGEGACTGEDQRGASRPEGEACDSGAFEYVADVELTVRVSGQGSGTVTGPQGLVCDSVCTVSAPYLSEPELIAVPDAGSLFVGFTGDCEGPSCRPLMTESRTVTAVFDLIPIPPPPDGGDSPGGQKPGGGDAPRDPAGGGPGGKQRALAGLAAKMRLKRDLAGRVSGRLRVVAKRGRITRLRVIAPKALRLAGLRKLRRSLQIRANGKRIAKRSISRKGRVLTIRNPAAKRIVIRAKAATWRIRPNARVRKLRFKVVGIASNGRRAHAVLRVPLR